MPTALRWISRIQDADDYASAHTWAGAATFQAGVTVSTAPLCIGSTVASDGYIRLPNNQAINWRNAGNDADIGIVLNSWDEYEFTGPVLFYYSSECRLKIDSEGESKLVYLEGGDERYFLGYDPTNNYLHLYSYVTGNGDADVFRVPDGQLTIDANTTWDENVFDYVCEACGWHNARPTETCPDCGGNVEWHDDVALITQAMRQPDNASFLDRLDRLGVVKRSDTPGHAWISLQEALKFTWSGLGQLSLRIKDLEAQLEAIQ